jgi:peptidyl-prolyl cis-trans isomerase A (cyclophilin A)
MADLPPQENGAAARDNTPVERLCLSLAAVALAGLAACADPKPAPEAPKAAKPIQAPEIFRVKFETSKGDFVVEVHRAWAPRGADRFYELVEANYFDQARFYRVLKKFIAQFGTHANPKVNALWSQMRIPDDPPKEKNRRGTLAFAKEGPSSRTTQIFINLADNRILDQTGFVPFGKIVEGMEAADQISAFYGELSPKGGGPDPRKLEGLGNEYLEREFPRLDYIKKARIVRD